MSSPTLFSVQFLRAVAALGVFAFHLEGRLPDYGIHWPHILQVFAYSGVDLFFVISGFILCYVHFDAIGRQGGGRPFIVRRLLRIYSNYLPFVLLVHGLMILGVMYGQADVDIMASYLLVPPMAFPHHLLSVAWSLNFELFFYAIFACMLPLQPRYFNKALLLWLTIILATQPFITYRRELSWVQFVFSSYHLEFLTGVLAALAIRRGYKSFARLLFWGGIAGLVLALWLLPAWHGIHIEQANFRAWRGLVFALGYGAIVYGAVAMELRGLRLGGPWWWCIGNASYSLYLCHLPLMAIIFFLWNRSGLPHILPNPFSALCLIALQWWLVLNYSLWHYDHIERPVLRWAYKHFRL